MYLNFIGCLIIMRYVFQLIVFIVSIPFRLALPLVSKTQNGMAVVHTTNQITVSVVYSALLATISYAYASKPIVDMPEDKITIQLICPASCKS